VTTVYTSRPCDGLVKFCGEFAPFDVEFTLGGAERVVESASPLPIVAPTRDTEKFWLAVKA